MRLQHLARGIQVFALAHHLGEALRDTRYLDATREVLQKHGSLWFMDESYVVSRKRD